MKSSTDQWAVQAKFDPESDRVQTANTEWVVQQKLIVDSKAPHETLIQSLQDLFARHHIPYGLLAKLGKLRRFNKLHFLVDDSGSMNEASDLLLSDAVYINTRFPIAVAGTVVTRWREVENRLHLMVDMLKFIETGPILISFFNSPATLELRRYNNQSPDEFAFQAHQAIEVLFNNNAPNGR